MEIGLCQVKLSSNEWIAHFDFKSHYPSRQKLNYFPTGFKHMYEIKEDFNVNDSFVNETFSLKELEYLCNDKCVLMTLAFKNLKLKRNVTAPYLSVSHSLNTNYICRNEKGVKGTDNGKIIDAEGIILFTLTELDWIWVQKQYDTDGILILDVWTSERSTFPTELQSVIDEFFYIKETEIRKRYRDKIKNWLNSIYGMTATDIIRADVLLDLDTGEWTINRAYKKTSQNKELINGKLNKYYNSRNNFMSYQYGVYTTAHARNELFKLIEEVGYQYFIYADTDSIFFVATEENMKKIEKYNNAIKKLNIGIDTDKGRVYYGTFENEKDDIKRFKFLHAKCYAIEHSDGTLSITIAGVTKDNKQIGKAKITREMELGCIENLSDEFKFVECGGTRADYGFHKPELINIDGHDIELASWCTILKSEKQLSSIEHYEEYEPE
ncbi:MAG: hypothetical protein J5993_06280 [Clostridia bacterium]|nr:hypothetical protein [Clostridia bacterium]